MTMEADNFIAFLPGDNSDLSCASTQTVLEVINDDLAHLLRLPPAQFWQVVVTDKSLHSCLDSFLRFKRRCYDDSQGSIQGSSDLLLQLSQRVFRVFWRLVHPQEAHGNGAAAAAGGQAAAAFKHQQQKQPPPRPPSPTEVAELLYNNWLVDVPKMLDIAVLYGPSNSKLTAQWLQQLLLLQPKYAQDLLTLSDPLTGNLQELLGKVKRLAATLLAAPPGTQGQLLQEVTEALKYLIDTCWTLQALVNCLPQAAALLLHPSNHGGVLLALGTTYSTLLPLLYRVSQQPVTAAGSGLRVSQVERLQHCVVSVVFQLLCAAFCTPEGAAASGGPDAIAAAAAATSSSSSSGVRKPPPGFGTQQAAAAVGQYDPDQQGQQLMNLLMLLSHPNDHEVLPGFGSTGSSSTQPALLAAVNRTFHLDAAVEAAVQQGFLALDDAQFDYLLALVGGDRQLVHDHQQQQQQQRRKGDEVGFTGAAASTNSLLPAAAELAGLLSVIKELLPDYGDGFLTACLYHTNWSTEQVINCLLEGSLPAAVQGVDPRLASWAPPGAAGPASSSSGRLSVDPASSSSRTNLSWVSLAKEAAAADVAAAAPAAANIPLPSLAQAAATAPRAAVDKRTGRVLGALPSQVRSLTRNIAYELQFEYDDEYDDSFDDLIGPGNDGVCDIEGEDSHRQQLAGSTAPPPSSSSSSAAAAAAAAAGRGHPGESSSSSSSSSNAAAARAAMPRQQQRGKPKQERLWVLDGKIYNYKKDGAVEVAGQGGAQKALQEAKQTALEIHGLGPGGNVPLAVPAGGHETGGGGTSTSSGRKPSGTGHLEQPRAAAGQGGGRGGGRTADGAAAAGEATGHGRGRGSYHHKEQHKAAVANHHRKDRAASKHAKGMF